MLDDAYLVLTAMKITERSLAQLRPAAKERVVWDSELPGFGVRIKSSGNVSFVIQYRHGGRSRRLTLGPASVLKVFEARDRARRMLVEVRDGRDPAQERQEGRIAPTISSLAERYLLVHASTKKKPRSRASDETNLRIHVLPHLGSIQVRDVTRQQIASLHHKMKGTPGAANRTMALLSKMLNLAEEWGWREDGSNPCRHIQRYAERKMERYLSNAELERLGDVLTQCESQKSESSTAIAAIRFLILTGARLGEALSLQWSHVDLDRSCLFLPDSKTGRKTIYVNAPTCSLLAARLDFASITPWVFGSDVNPGSPLVNLRKPWHRIRAIAGLHGVRLHDLRHSFASIAAAGGLSLPLIGALLGHKHPTTTARYAHLAAEPLHHAAELVGARIAHRLTLVSPDISLPEQAPKIVAKF